jgi:putative tryptophan/tyrosine transport system ATP-binding protein
MEALTNMKELSISMKIPLLQIKNVSLTFEEHYRPILDNITTTIHKGEFVVILGGNGSGKSTLIKLMNKTYPLKNGSIFLDQKNLIDCDTNEFARSVVTLEQDPRSSLFYDLTVLENCILWETRFGGKSFRFSNRVEKKIYGSHLLQYHPRLHERLNTAVRLLSGGEKQALLLALCIFHPPKLLLLDEHTSALDPHQAESIMSHTIKVINKYGITTLMTTHNLEHALKFGDRLLAIKEGKIVFDAENEHKRNLTKTDLLKFCY